MADLMERGAQGAIVVAADFTHGACWMPPREFRISLRTRVWIRQHEMGLEYSIRVLHVSVTQLPSPNQTKPNQTKPQTESNDTVKY